MRRCELHRVNQPSAGKNPCIIRRLALVWIMGSLTNTSSGTKSSELALLLHALSFAAHNHRDQRRRNREASLYINHAIDVASIIANIGEVNDLVTLVGALEREFGFDVRQLVER